MTTRLPTKSYSDDIAGARRQYAGNAGGVILGIGIVTCVYYSAALDRFSVIDYRIFDPDRDGKSKLDHVSEMPDSIDRRHIAFRTVLMDSWYATTASMTHLMTAEKFFYCPLKKNWQVDQSGGAEPYQAVETLSWTAADEQTGKTVKLRGCAGATYLKLFRVAVFTSRTESIVTNEF